MLPSSIVGASSELWYLNPSLLPSSVTETRTSTWCLYELLILLLVPIYSLKWTLLLPLVSATWLLQTVNAAWSFDLWCFCQLSWLDWTFDVSPDVTVSQRHPLRSLLHHWSVISQLVLQPQLICYV
jgi:hypothetical protein